MKCILTVLCLAWMFLPHPAVGEPISFEQAANVTGFRGGTQFGLDAGYDPETVMRGPVLADLHRTLTEVRPFVRVGWTSMEFYAGLPYRNLHSDAPETGQTSFSGFRDFGVAGKYNVYLLPILCLAGGVQARIPLVGQDHQLYGEGLALYPFAAGDVVTNYFIFHMQIGWEYAAPYRRLSDTGEGTTDFRPSSMLQIALGAEAVLFSGFWLMAEATDQSFGPAFSDGNYLAGSDRPLFTLTPGVRYQALPWKFQAGFQIPLAGRDNRPTFTPTYDWRVLAGASLLLPFQ